MRLLFALLYMVGLIALIVLVAFFTVSCGVTEWQRNQDKLWGHFSDLSDPKFLETVEEAKKLPPKVE